MKTAIQRTLLLCLAAALMGCASFTETAKSVWGTSITPLELARTDALRKTYTCDLKECYEAALSLARNEESLEPQTQKLFDVFLKDSRRRHIVVMGIQGNVDTTEVGIFFDDLGQDTVRIEISSLSTSAKKKVARAVFEEFDQRFPFAR